MTADNRRLLFTRMAGWKPGKVQCDGYEARWGTPCRRAVWPADRWCWQHNPKEATRDR